MNGSHRHFVAVIGLDQPGVCRQELALQVSDVLCST